MASTPAAQEARINLMGADLRGANLSGADLIGANLSWANLRGVDLNGANLRGATLNGADLGEANLSGANLAVARMDALTELEAMQLDTKTYLGEVYWGDAVLTRVDWGQIPRLGDELVIAYASTRAVRIITYRASARAYRGLGMALRRQGLLLPASGYRLREQRLERKAAWYGRRYGEWLFSALLDLVAGYGEAVERILFSYLLVVGSFAAAYWAVTHYLETKLSALSWDEAIVLSLTSFHGRGFFPGFLSLGDWVARLGALEAVIGLFIELILIATFSRRFPGN